VQWIYPYNRAGAVFVPGGDNGTDFVASVIESSPAHAAGIRKGDVLLKIDELDVTKWQTDPAVLPLHRFWSRPSGTKLRLLLRREGRTFEATVELKDVLQPAATPAATSRASKNG
jgi:C-terminal processing protease CtpA/Prc